MQPESDSWCVRIEQTIPYRPAYIEKLLDDVFRKYGLQFPRTAGIVFPPKSVPLRPKGYRYFRNWTTFSCRLPVGKENEIIYQKDLAWEETPEGFVIKTVPAAGGTTSVRAEYVDPAAVAEIFNDPSHLASESVLFIAGQQQRRESLEIARPPSTEAPVEGDFDYSICGSSRLLDDAIDLYASSSLRSVRNESLKEIEPSASMVPALDLDAEVSNLRNAEKASCIALPMALEIMTYHLYTL